MKICVDFDPDNWKEDLGFADEQENIITGFKGVIYYRKDTVQNNEAGYDFRAMKFRRWEIEADEWDEQMSLNKGDFVIKNDILYVSVADTNNTDPETYDGSFIACLDLSEDKFVLPASQGYVSSGGINWPLPSSSYNDFFTFSEYSESYNNRINLEADEEHVSIAKGVVFIGSAIDNLINGANSTLLGDTYVNTFNYAHNCIMRDATLNNISVLMDVINTNFHENRCLFRSITSCIFGEDCSFNFFDSDFYSNYISSTFFNNNILTTVGNSIILQAVNGNVLRGMLPQTIPENFANNTIKQAQVDMRGVDLSSATHIVSGYCCDIFVLPDITVKLSYVDNNGMLQIVDVTD